MAWIDGWPFVRPLTDRERDVFNNLNEKTTAILAFICDNHLFDWVSLYGICPIDPQQPNEMLSWVNGGPPLMYITFGNPIVHTRDYPPEWVQPLDMEDFAASVRKLIIDEWKYLIATYPLEGFKTMPFVTPEMVEDWLNGEET